MAFESNRFQAAIRSKATGLPTITGPIILVQDQKKTPGFLFYVPYYSDPGRKDFKGFVYAPFIVKELMRGTLDHEKRKVGFRITDESEVIYDEFDREKLKLDDSTQLKSRTIEFYGRTWTFDFRTNHAYKPDSVLDESDFILAGGLIIDGLLILIFSLLKRSESRAKKLAENMTKTLSLQRDELERSNEELEQFAYITSHDLKTPVRAIGDLMQFLEEDLREHMQTQNLPSDIQNNIDRMHNQVTRMNRLIAGLLEYSLVDAKSAHYETFAMKPVIREVVRDSGLEGKITLKLEGEALYFGDKTKIKHLIYNLLSNSWKYRTPELDCEIHVNIKVNDDESVQISFSDNGIGIDPKYYEKVFTIFQTLHAKHKFDSTGLGLTMCKKIVELTGGKI